MKPPKRPKPTLAIVPTGDLGEELPPLLGSTVRKVGSPAQMWDLFEVYEQDCRANDQPITLAGAALALGFSSRAKMMDYRAKPEFADILDRIKTTVEAEYEAKLHGGSASGAIFWLKAQAGYRDRLDIGNPEGEAFKTGNEPTESELELLRRVGFMLAKQRAEDGEFTEIEDSSSPELEQDPSNKQQQGEPDGIQRHDVSDS